MALRRKQPQLMILSSTMKPAEDTVFAWIQNITQHIQPCCVVAVAGAGFLSYIQLLKKYAIPYIENIQDVKLFTPHYIFTNVSDMSFVQPSIE